MSYLLDTNVVSELRKRRGVVDERVREWAEVHAADTSHLSVVTIMEFDLGIALRARHDPRSAAILRSWLEDSLLPTYRNRILEVDLTVARRAAHLHVPDPMEERDGLIAATAIIHGLTLVTRNTTHFERTGVPLVNPWEFEG